MEITRGSDELQRQIIEQARISFRLLGEPFPELDQLSAELRRLDANRELRGIIGSWGDTLEPESVLELLIEWTGAEEQLQRERQPLSA